MVVSLRVRLIGQLVGLLFALRAEAATTASPICSFPDPDALDARGWLLLDEGRIDVATNAFLFRSADEKVPAWRAHVRREEEADGVVLESEGGSGLLGRMDLAPETLHVVELWNFEDPQDREPRLSLSFTSGTGADDEPPQPPEIVDEFVTESLPSLPEDGECGGTIPGRDGATRIEWEVTGELGTTLLLFDLSVDDSEPVRFAQILHKGEGRTSIQFRTAEPGIREFGFVLEDVAGNQSEQVVVEADFGGCGACTQTSLAPSVIALVMLRCARRRSQWRE